MKNLFIFMTLLFLFTNLQAASFDCRKASSPVEKKICKNDELSGLDKILGEAFQNKIKASSTLEKENLKKEQKVWIANRNQCMGLLPDEAEACLEENYNKRIKNLDGSNELLMLYRERCQKEDWNCLKLGNLDIEMGKWPEAVTDLKALCEADHDGDMGESCYRKAFALEHLGKKAEALEQFSKTCKERQHNEACAAAYRLTGKKSSNSWVGLYRNETGTIFVSEIDGGKVSVNADTHWANGHYCGWSKVGIIKNDKLIAEVDSQSPNCTPVIEKQGSKVKVQDPQMNCKNSYCGARALFAGEFTFDPKSSL
jgi:uncharacterized protein